MKKTLTALALLAATPSFADGLDPIVGDRLGVHSHNGCEIVIFAQPRTILFGLIPHRWDYTSEGRQCKREWDAANAQEGDDDNDVVIDTRPPECRTCNT